MIIEILGVALLGNFIAWQFSPIQDLKKLLKLYNLPGYFGKNTLLVKTAVTTFWITAKLCYLFISLPCHTVHKPRQTMSHSTQFKASFRYCFIQ